MKNSKKPDSKMQVDKVLVIDTIIKKNHFWLEEQMRALSEATVNRDELAAKIPAAEAQLEARKAQRLVLQAEEANLGEDLIKAATAGGDDLDAIGARAVAVGNEIASLNKTIGAIQTALTEIKRQHSQESTVAFSARRDVESAERTNQTWLLYKKLAEFLLECSGEFSDDVIDTVLNNLPHGSTRMYTVRQNLAEFVEPEALETAPQVAANNAPELASFYPAQPDIFANKSNAVLLGGGPVTPAPSLRDYYQHQNYMLADEAAKIEPDHDDDEVILGVGLPEA